MKRVYSNYSEADYQLISKKAKDLGFSFSAYQHYCVMLSLGIERPYPINELIDKLFQRLERVKPNSQFIVSDLLANEWLFLSRSEKMILAKQLAAKIRGDSRFGASAKAGKTTIYNRKENS